MITATQKEQRTKHVGASDVAAIMGMSPYGSAHDVWLAKTGRVDDVEETDAMVFGNAAERMVQDLWKHYQGSQLVKPTATFMDRAMDGILRVNPDFFIGKAQRGSPLVQAKASMRATRDDDWGTPGTSEVPPFVYAQEQAEMAACDSDIASVGRVFGGFVAGFSIYHVPRDADFIEIMRDAIGNFWHNCVLKDTPPPESQASIDALSRRKREPGSVVQVDPQIVADFLAAKATLKEAEAVEEAAKARLLQALGDAEEGAVEGYSVSYRQQAKSGINLDGLRTEYPEIAAKLATKTTYRVLRASAKKEKKS